MIMQPQQTDALADYEVWSEYTIFSKPVSFTSTWKIEAHIVISYEIETPASIRKFAELLHNSV